MNYTLDVLLENVRNLRSLVQRYKDEYSTVLEKFKESQKHTIELIKNYEIDLENAESSLREEALAVYQVEKNKEVYTYLKERDVTRFSYDEEKALEYCVMHNLFLKFDKKGFETYLRALKGRGLPSFVKQVVHETITIASEL